MFLNETIRKNYPIITKKLILKNSSQKQNLYIHLVHHKNSAIAIKDGNRFISVPQKWEYCQTIT